MELDVSGDGTVPRQTLEHVAKVGATVASDERDGVRPSVQITSAEPADRHGFQKAKVRQD